jgi:hypothetical protein
MENNNLISMIGHVSQSLFSVMHLVGGLAYVLGLLLMIIAVNKFRNNAGHLLSSQGSFIPIAYLLGGIALLFLPSAIPALSNTVFGVGNVLAYSSYNSMDLMSAMTVFIHTAGLIWFVRGCVLLTQASEPGVQHGPKGLLFLIAGIFAINFESTLAFINWLFNYIASFTLTSPPTQ